MPDNDKARFEPQEVLSSKDFTFRENKEKSTAQANETFVMDANSNRSLGDNGETLAFAKKQFSADPVVQELRDNAVMTAQEELGAMKQDVEVGAWVETKEKVANIDSQLKFAKVPLDTAKEALKDAIDNEASPDDIAALQAEVVRREKQVAVLEQFKQDVPQTNQLLAQALAQNPDIQNYVRQEQKLEAAKNLANSTNLVADSSSNLYADSAKMGDPAEGGDRHLIARSVASAKVDQLIGTNVIAQEKFALDDQNKLLGVSVQADGAGVRSQDGENEWLESQTAFLNIDYSKPKVQQGLYDLEAVDYITGQIDRHQGNIFVDPKSGKVTGIDNDLAFPEQDREQMLQSNKALLEKAVGGMPKMMHQDTADKIAAITPDELRATLKAVQPPDGGEGLSDAEIEGAVKRLGDLQTAIKNSPGGGIEVVQAFDKNTYAASIAAQKAQNQMQLAGLDANSTKEAKYNNTSYIGSIENEREFAQAKVDAGDSLYKMRDAKSAGKAKLNTEYAAYKQLDPGQQAQYQKLQKDVDKLEDKLSETRKQIEKLTSKESNLKNNLANLRHGGVDGTLKHLMKKEAAITDELRTKRGAAEDLAKPAQQQAVGPQVVPQPAPQLPPVPQASLAQQGIGPPKDLAPPPPGAKQPSLAQQGIGPPKDLAPPPPGAKQPSLAQQGIGPPKDLAPPPPGDKGYEAEIDSSDKKMKPSSIGAEDEQDVSDLDDLDDDEIEVEVKKEKPEVAKVGDMLRKSGGPIIGAQGRTQSTGDLKAMAGDLGEKPKLERTNSLRDSKEWQAAAKPKTPAPKQSVNRPIGG